MLLLLLLLRGLLSVLLLLSLRRLTVLLLLLAGRSTGRSSVQAKIESTIYNELTRRGMLVQIGLTRTVPAGPAVPEADRTVPVPAAGPEGAGRTTAEEAGRGEPCIGTSGPKQDTSARPSVRSFHLPLNESCLPVLLLAGLLRGSTGRSAVHKNQSINVSLGRSEPARPEVAHNAAHR